MELRAYTATETNALIRDAGPALLAMMQYKDYGDLFNSVATRGTFLMRADLNGKHFGTFSVSRACDCKGYHVIETGFMAHTLPADVFSVFRAFDLFLIHAFERMKVTAIYAKMYADNKPICAIMKRCRFNAVDEFTDDDGKRQIIHLATADDYRRRIKHGAV